MIRLTCARAALERAASIANGARPCSARRRFSSCSNVCSADDAPFWAKAAGINIIRPSSVIMIRCICVLSLIFEEGQDLFGMAFGFYLFEGVDEALVGADEVGGSFYALYEFAVHIFW